LNHRARAARTSNQGQGDLLEIGRRQSAEFQVPPGACVVRADGRRRCSLRVRSDEWRTARAQIVCPR
jgi:hypothetical protein